VSYIWQSVKTASYWKYAVFSVDGVKTFFAVLGSVWLIIEVIDNFHIGGFKKDNIPGAFFYAMLFVSLFIVIITRGPIRKTKYLSAEKDLCVEVIIGDLFKCKGQKIISTNTTFDTDISNGVIASDSLQGKFTQIYFPNNIHELDEKIAQALQGEQFVQIQKIAGKTKKYPLGTTVRINFPNETYYMMSMSDLNSSNTAHSTLDNVLSSISKTFEFIREKGENSDIAIPLVGKGKGRITTPPKQLIARIAQTFMSASRESHFSKKLTIVVSKHDAKNFSINLHEVRDLLQHYLR
jgi:hypothetical protein